VSEREVPEGGGELAQFLPPVSGSGVDGEVGKDPCDDAVQQRVFAGNVAVQRHHLPVEGLPETAHCQCLGTFGVHDLQGGGHDAAGAHARAAALGWLGGDVHAGGHLTGLLEGRESPDGLPCKLTP
jgi:hypothetical protein